jgi:hypothetical protein
VCHGVTDYFEKLSEKMSMPPDVLARNSEKVETDARQHDSQAHESEDGLKRLVNYARENSSLRRNADLLLRAGHGTYRIPIASRRGLAILAGYLQKDPVGVIR